MCAESGKSVVKTPRRQGRTRDPFNSHSTPPQVSNKKRDWSTRHFCQHLTLEPLACLACDFFPVPNHIPKSSRIETWVSALLCFDEMVPMAEGVDTRPLSRHGLHVDIPGSQGGGLDLHSLCCPTMSHQRRNSNTPLISDLCLIGY